MRVRTDLNRASDAGAKDYYQALDFLRGVAAIMVVLFHFSSRVDVFGLFVHGYLAVDFFFALSGYVIDRVYGRRLESGELTVSAFCLLRVVRLMPMVVFGTLLAMAVDVFRPGDYSRLQHARDIAVTAILGLLLLPTFWRTTLENTTYPLNGPVWSLLLEMCANIGHAVFFRERTVNRRLIVLMAFSLFALAAVALTSDGIHVGTSRQTFVLGFARVFWPYSLGIVLSRTNVRSVPLSKWQAGGLLCCVFACPKLPAQFSGMFDLFVVCWVVPFVVVGAASDHTTGRQSTLAKWCGDMSYPLYLLHYPVVRAVGVVCRRAGFPALANLITAAAVTLLLALMASIAHSAYDVPVRRWLSRRARSFHAHAREESAGRS